MSTSQTPPTGDQQQPPAKPTLTVTSSGTQPVRTVVAIQDITLSVVGLGPELDKDGKPTGKLVAKHIAVSAHDVPGVLAALEDHDHAHAEPTHDLISGVVEAAEYLLENYRDAHKIALGITPEQIAPGLTPEQAKAAQAIADQRNAKAHDTAVEAALPTK